MGLNSDHFEAVVESVSGERQHCERVTGDYCLRMKVESDREGDHGSPWARSSAAVADIGEQLVKINRYLANEIFAIQREVMSIAAAQLELLTRALAEATGNLPSSEPSIRASPQPPPDRRRQAIVIDFPDRRSRGDRRARQA